MDAESLRALQAPIKARYREEPGSALVTLSARAELGDGELSCRVPGAGGAVEAGLHPAAGGDGSFACSGDMLLQALVACAGVTLKAVATAIGVEVRGGAVCAEADLDFRGTMGIDKAAPVGFRAIRLRFEVQSSTDPSRLADLLRLTERYCVVYQTLRNGTEITSTLSPT
jgi:uncharacterized OsmC-like protein